MKNKRNILIISGPTGSGESTITREIIKLFPNFTRLVTATSRPPRGKEQDGKDYYFFSKKRFESEIKKGNIIEHTYIKNRGQYYGSYKKDLNDKLANNFNIIVNPDIIGTKYYKKHHDAIAIFIRPQSILCIKNRLIKRNPNISQEELDRRLENARNEMKYEQPFYDYIVVNRDGQLDKVVRKIASIIKKEGYEFD